MDIKNNGEKDFTADSVRSVLVNMRQAEKDGERLFVYPKDFNAVFGQKIAFIMNSVSKVLAKK